MAFSLADHWMWDHWIVRRGDQYHLFFLRASKALHDPERRHRRASIGHAVSSDARSWTLLPDALVHSDGPAFDDQATWTGSAVVRADGTIRLFYTGISRREGGMVQRVGWADSCDGVVFTRACAEPVEADGRWYEKWNPSCPWDEPWRDPYVFRHEGRWHMLLTARRAGVDRLHAGVVGHAVSDDLDHWEVLEPLTEPGQFGQLEVCQSRLVGGEHLLVFSCGRDMQAAASEGTVWVAQGEGPLGPWDVDNARYVEPTHLYAGQVFELAEGQWAFTGFDDGQDGVFRGVVPDPLPWSQVRLSQPPGQRGART